MWESAQEFHTPPKNIHDNLKQGFKYLMVSHYSSNYIIEGWEKQGLIKNVWTNRHSQYTLSYEFEVTELFETLSTLSKL